MSTWSDLPKPAEHRLPSGPGPRMVLAMASLGSLLTAIVVPFS